MAEVVVAEVMLAEAVMAMVEPNISRILVAADGSPQAKAACRMAVGLARCYEAALTALYVAMPTQPGGSINPADYVRAQEAARTHGAQVLNAARTLARGYAPFTAELEFGDPAPVICRRAQELNVDLVVVGSRGLGTLDRLLLGSVSSAVTQRAPCSVLVVR